MLTIRAACVAAVAVSVFFACNRSRGSADRVTSPAAGEVARTTRPADRVSPAASVPSNPQPAGADLALDDNGGAIESITGEYGPGLTGRRLVDGKSGPVWAWRGSALRELPMEIVLSFYKHEPVLAAAVTIGMPGPDADGKPNGNAPKDVEIWISNESAETGFQKVAAASLAQNPSTQTIALQPVEARYVKVRVVSVQGPIWALSRVEIAEIGVLESQRGGYVQLAARNPDLPGWKDSPRHAAQRGIDWLQPSAVQWQLDHNCFGCHIQAQAVMGLAIAKKNDYIVSDRAIKDLIDFTEAQQHADGSYVREDTGEPSTQFAAMGLAYADDLNGVNGNPKLIRAVDWLLPRQKPAGDLPYREWQACANRAVEQGSMMTTANSLAAFERAFVETHDARYRAAADRARTWIAAAVPVTTQDKVFKLLALARFGGADRKAPIQRLVEQLILEQNPAGGWRDGCDAAMKESNPFSTGQVLYAFKQAGVGIDSPPFMRGVKYLLQTQSDDGSWPADAHQFHTMGAPHAPTMWAIIGLAGSFGRSRTGALHVTTDLSPEQAAARHNLEIILDLSGSMKLPLGASTRIATARQVLREVLSKVPDDMNVGLRVYAHRFGARQKETCTDTELVSPIAKLDRARILSVANRLQPRGETPLVYSILQAPADLKPLGGGSIVVITDGEETCGGDPARAAQQLEDAGVPITMNIVGFTLTGQKTEQELSAFAEAAGGRYYSARDGEALGKAITDAALTQIPYTVYDAKGAQVAAGTAGPLAEELQPGAYKVVVKAGDRELTQDVTVSAGSTVAVTVARRNGAFQLISTPSAAR